jgi:hypothetical protein
MPLTATSVTTKRDDMRSPTVTSSEPKPPVRPRPSTAPSW